MWFFIRPTNSNIMKQTLITRVTHTKSNTNSTIKEIISLKAM